MSIKGSAQTYRDVEGILGKLVYSHLSRYGGDKDVLMAIAEDAFLVAYDSWDQRSQFSTWVYNKVRFALMEEARRAARHHSRFPGAPLPVDKPAREGWLTLFLRELSDDAKTLVRLIAEAPGELALLCDIRSPKQCRKILRQELQGRYRWSLGQTMRAFSEVAEALDGRC